MRLFLISEKRNIHAEAEYCIEKKEFVVLKGSIVSIVTMLVYKRISPILKSNAVKMGKKK